MIEEYLAMEFFGNSSYQILGFLAIFFGTMIIGKIIKKVLLSQFEKIADKTGTRIDDILVSMISKLIVPLSVILGIYIGLQILTIPGLYVDLVGEIFYLVILCVLGWIAISLVDTIIDEWLRPLTAKTKSDIDDQLIPILSKGSKGLIMLIIGIMILSEFNFDITALVASLGIGGLAFAFAAQETIADMFGGITILTSRPFKTGDYVEIEGIEGTVKEISIRHTRIARFESGIATIPNRKAASAIIKNFSKERKKKVVMKLGLTYETSNKKLETAKKILASILKKRKEVDKDEITIRFDGFGASELKLTVIYYITDKNNWLNIRSEINTEIKKQFDSKKIDFAYPTQTVFLKR